jgi:hypothetical protein
MNTLILLFVCLEFLSLIPIFSGAESLHRCLLYKIWHSKRLWLQGKCLLSFGTMLVPAFKI